MKSVCEAIDVATLGTSMQQQLGRKTISQAARVFASTFRTLQAVRLLADYHPSAPFSMVDAADYIALAATGMEAFNRIATDEKTNLLALMLTPSRA